MEKQLHQEGWRVCCGAKSPAPWSMMKTAVPSTPSAACSISPSESISEEADPCPHGGDRSPDGSQSHRHLLCPRPECTRISANPAGYHLVEMPGRSNRERLQIGPGRRAAYLPDVPQRYRAGRQSCPCRRPPGWEWKSRRRRSSCASRMAPRNSSMPTPSRSLTPRARSVERSHPCSISPSACRGEEDLRARTEEIETLMEVSPIGMMVAHDPQCNHITGNPAANLSSDFQKEPTKPVQSGTRRERQPTGSTVTGVELAVPDLPMQMAARLGTEVKRETLELRFEDGAEIRTSTSMQNRSSMAKTKARGADRSHAGCHRAQTGRIMRSGRARSALPSSCSIFPAMPGSRICRAAMYMPMRQSSRRTTFLLAELYGKTDLEVFPEEVAAAIHLHR